MKKIQKTFLSVLIIASLAVNAVASVCGGKTVYAKIPSDWSAPFYYYAAGSFSTVTSTSLQGDGWYVFNLTEGSPYDITDGFALAKEQNFSSTQKWIGRQYNVLEQIIGTNVLIPCTAFGSGDVVYIMENPENPGVTVISAEPPGAKYFYLLPPRTRNWIEGIPYIMDAGGDKMPMAIDPSSCGWYKAVYFSKEPPTAMMIGIGPSMQTPINGGVFNLAAKFQELGNTIYYDADNNRWLTSRAGIPEQTDRCSYLMAAIIYDTDESVNASFTDYTQDIGPGGDQYGYWTSGIIEGMVKPNLNPATKKIECDNCAKGGTPLTSMGYFLSKQDFDDAFKPTEGKNVMLCYDMPFARSSAGLWEFDSDKMTNHQGKTVGGFFPEILQNRAMAVAEGGADYSNCPSCDAKHPAESFVNLTDSINPWCFERGFRTTRRTGQNMSSCGVAYGPGDFAHGGLPANTWGATPTGSATWLESWRYNQINLWGGSDVGKNAVANQFFCFESHATFKYDPAQEFFFRGDDDIWVYIHNKLVVDLGGPKMAAPGYVNLKDKAVELGLEIGETYPIDIFFCDRRTAMSNIRIASNIYFAQTAANGADAGLYLQPAGAGKEICLIEAANSCAVLTGKASAEPVCGAALAPRLSYYLVVPGTGNIQLNSAASGCVWSNPTQGVCYGGIAFNNGIVSIDEGAISGLPNLGFEIYASVSSYSPLNVSRTDPAPIAKIPPKLQSNEPRYYSLKGEQLGNQKPKKAGIYIVRQNGVNRTVMVR